MKNVTKIGQVPLQIFFFLVFNDIIDTSAQLLMKKGLGVADLKSISSFFHLLFNFTNHDIFIFWLGLMIYISNFFLWMSILSQIDLSVALPLACIGYILIPISSAILFHEHVPALRWLGLFLIIMGIIFVSQSKSRETKHE